MSDGITDAYEENKETPQQEMARGLKLFKYHYKELGIIIQSFEEALEKNKNITDSIR